MIIQDVWKTDMQTYIKREVYYDKKSNVPKQKLQNENDVYFLQLRTSHHGSKIHSTEVH